MSDYRENETRARELMLDVTDRLAFIRLMTVGDRGDYHVYCPDCGARLETYETTVLRHVRTCKALQTAAKGATS